MDNYSAQVCLQSSNIGYEHVLTKIVFVSFAQRFWCLLVSFFSGFHVISLASYTLFTFRATVDNIAHGHSTLVTGFVGNVRMSGDRVLLNGEQQRVQFPFKGMCDKKNQLKEIFLA